jgi:hypothetical protein
MEIRICLSITTSWKDVVRILNNSGADLKRILGETDGARLPERILCAGEDVHAVSRSRPGVVRNMTIKKLMSVRQERGRFIRIRLM